MFLNDWTCGQAKAVRAMLDGQYDGVESSWLPGYRYEASPYISEWHNGRENGYVITLSHHRASKHLVIVFYEHRNSDNICFLVWESDSGFLNPPTLDDIPDGLFKHSADVTESFKYGEIGKAATYAYDKMEKFWKRCNQECK
jgi:hypothetical protein